MYCLCSKCERQFHLAIQVPRQEWIDKHAPGTPPLETPKVLCVFCWMGHWVDANKKATNV